MVKLVRIWFKIRSWVDFGMPKAVFTTSAAANENLRRGGIREEQIFFVGNTMIDTLVRNRQKFVRPPFFDELGLQEKNFFTITLHRPSNVDDPERLCLILTEIEKHTRDIPFVFPFHPLPRLSPARIK